MIHLPIRPTLAAMLGLALVGLGVSAVPVEAQGIPIGRWITTYYPIGASHDGGTVEAARAQMTLVQQGDSVLGRWEPLAGPEGSSSALALRGTARAGVITLVADPVRVLIRRHIGPDQRVDLVTTYEFQVRGDSLVGTQRSRSADGKITNNPRAFVAVRERP